MTYVEPAPKEFSEDEILTDPVLQYFHYGHLPEGKLQDTSRQFCALARVIVDTCPRNPERTKALNKLLEAKDCAVRTHVR